MLKVADSRSRLTPAPPIQALSPHAKDLRLIRRHAGEVATLSRDPGFTNLDARTNRTVCIGDGKGILRYWGCQIEVSAEEWSLIEVAYSFLAGGLCTRPQLDGWGQQVAVHSRVRESVRKLTALHAGIQGKDHFFDRLPEYRRLADSLGGRPRGLRVGTARELRAFRRKHPGDFDPHARHVERFVAS